MPGFKQERAKQAEKFLIKTIEIFSVMAYNT
jgi:hypothetical protein